VYTTLVARSIPDSFAVLFFLATAAPLAVFDERRCFRSVCRRPGISV